jgi:hypothetical protein
VAFDTSSWSPNLFAIIQSLSLDKSIMVYFTSLLAVIALQAIATTFAAPLLIVSLTSLRLSQSPSLLPDDNLNQDVGGLGDTDMYYGLPSEVCASRLPRYNFVSSLILQ